MSFFSARCALGLHCIHFALFILHVCAFLHVVHSFLKASILPFLSKLFEKCLLKRLNGFLNKFHIISEYQFGFMKGKSTSDVSTTMTNYLYAAKDEKNHTIVVTID